MYYVISGEYVGPNQGEENYTDIDVIEIRTTPATYNMSGEDCLTGWCGTHNDWCVYAHGGYETLEQARECIASNFGETRRYGQDGDAIEFSESVIEVYKPGKYEPMSSQQTEDWCYGTFADDISADTTDERLANLVIEYEECANTQGLTLDKRALLNSMEYYRACLHDEGED